MAEKLKIGVIGCGGIANSKHLPAIKAVDMAQIMATCDIIEERAVKAAKEYGAEGCKVYTDYHDLLKLDLDAVFVLTPNRWHSEITCAALKSGKHVMCEKPMAHTYAAACEMLDAAKQSGKLLTIGYQGRYRANSQYLKQLCEDGELGEIYLGRANAIRRRAVPTWGVFLDEYAQGGGPLIDIGTHALDLTLWMMNNYQPRYCVGTTYHKLNKDTNQGNAWGAWDPEKFTVEDSAFGFVVMENGATVQVNAAWALNTLDVEEATTTLSGTLAGADMHAEHGGLAINGIKNNRQYTLTPNLKAGGAAFFEGKTADRPENIEHRIFCEAILGHGELTVLPEQAACVTRILEGIYTSARTGEPYYFDK